jgi:hypothetical protein
MKPEKLRRAKSSHSKGQENLPAAEPKGKQSDGKRVISEAVDVIGPQGEDAVAGPAPAFPLRRGKVYVVQAGADGAPGRGAGCFAQGVNARGRVDRLARQLCRGGSRVDAD